MRISDWSSDVCSSDLIDRIRAQGVEVTPERLRIAEGVALILPMHGAVDRAREAAKGDSKIGTPGRGIGPAPADKVGRRAVRLCDLADPALLPLRVAGLLLHNHPLPTGLGPPAFTAHETVASLPAPAPPTPP